MKTYKMFITEMRNNTLYRVLNAIVHNHHIKVHIPHDVDHATHYAFSFINKTGKEISKEVSVPSGITSMRDITNEIKKELVKYQL